MYTDLKFLIKYAFNEVSPNEKKETEQKLKNNQDLKLFLEFIKEEKAAQNLKNSNEYLNILDQTSRNMEQLTQNMLCRLCIYV